MAWQGASEAHPFDGAVTSERRGQTPLLPRALEGCAPLRYFNSLLALHPIGRSIPGRIVRDRAVSSWRVNEAVKILLNVHRLK